MKVEIIDGCISCGACIEICPDVFGLNEVAEVIGEPDEHEELVHEAAEACPVSVIITE